MAISPEETRKVKDQLLGQLVNFPEEKREEIKEQIESMSPSEIENFIRQNNLSHLGATCIFCSIINGDNPSFRITEDEKNIAILEINPLSKGHTLIVPKEHSKTIFESTKKFAKGVSTLIQKKLNPQKINSNEIEIMEHKLLELIPIYGNETSRSPAKKEDLSLLQEELKKPLVEEKETISEKDNSPAPSLPKIPPRIP